MHAIDYMKYIFISVMDIDNNILQFLTVFYVKDVQQCCFPFSSVFLFKSLKFTKRYDPIKTGIFCMQSG